MGEEFRKTGIDVLGEVPWGTHLCHFYQTKEDLIDILVPYFKAGLESDEFCVWVTSPPLEVKEAKAALKKAVKNLDKYIQKGRIEFIDYSDWYTRSGRFAADKALQSAAEKEGQALERGFAGLRGAGNITWLKNEDWTNGVAYETALAGVIGKHRMIAICSYALNRCSAAEVVDVVNNHQFALIRQQGQWQLMESAKHRQVEEALRKAEEEEYFHHSMDESPLGIRIVTPEGETVYSNQAILDIYGYGSVEELEITPRKERYTPESYAEHQVRKEKRKRGEYVPANYEISIVRKNGEIRDLEVFRKEMLWHGKTHFQVLYQDITERKRTEEALQESELRYRTLFETTGTASMLIEEDMTISLINAEYEKISGYSREEVEGKRKWTEFVVKEDLDRLKEYHCLRRTDPQSAPKQYECRLIDRWGNIKHVLMTVDVIPGTKRSIASFVDITERKRAEDALRQSEEKLAKVFRSMPDFASITSMVDGRFIDVNDSFLHTMGYTREEVVGHTVLELGLYVRPEERDRLISIMKEKKTIRNVELDFRTKSGEILKGQYSAEPIDLSGEICVITVVQDITERKLVEETLRQSEEKLSIIFETVAEGIVLTDLLGNILEANEEAARIAGYKKEELIGLNGFQIISPKDHARVAEDSQKGQREGYIGTREYTCLRKDGLEFTAEVNASFVQDASGNQSAIVCSIRDVTERRRAGEALRQSEEKLRVMFQSVPESIIITDLKGNILEVNEAALSQGRYNNKKEVIGRNVFEFALPIVRNEAGEESKRLKIGENLGPHEYMCLRKDGTEFPGEVSTSQLKDAAGNPAGYITVTRDITERRRAEELIWRSYDIQSVVNRILHLALREASLEELLRRALEIVLSASWLSLESGGSIFLVEDKPGALVMKAQIGLSRLMQKECALLPFGKCLCGQAALTQEIQFADCLDERHEIRYEGISPHGHYCVPIVGGSKVFGVMSLHLKEGQRRDPGNEDFLRAVADVLANIISHRQMEKKVAEYQELTRLKGNILSTVSHELRTPLASIKGYSTMLLDYEKKLRREEKRQCLEAIDRATDRLIELIDHLLDMSRLEAGIFRLAKQPCKIDQLIRETMVEAQLRSPEHKVRAELEEELPTLTVDGRRIRQVLDNLVDNAIKYSSKGTEVVFRAKVEADNIEISVSDQGKGIPAADIEKVFDPMYRLEERLGQDPRGLGLGLPLCKALVEAHGGRISIESALGKGTTVHFTLSLAERRGKNAPQTH